MSYIVVGLFPQQMDAEKILLKLENAGYNDYNISHSHQEIAQKVDIEKKKRFWGWLFNDNHLDKARFEYASIDHDTITVYVEKEQDAHIVKDLLDSNGAVNVEEKTQDFMTENFADSPLNSAISQNKNAKIIAKARSNLFFINNRKPHHLHCKRAIDEIDGLVFTKFK